MVNYVNENENMIKKNVSLEKPNHKLGIRKFDVKLQEVG